MGRGGDGSSSGGGGVETGAPCSWRSDRKTLVCVCVCVLSDTKRCRLRDKTGLVLNKREANWLNWPQVSLAFDPN